MNQCRVSRFANPAPVNCRQGFAAGHWTEVLSTADAVLELNLGDEVARRVKSQAWQVAQMDETQAYTGPRRAAARVALRMQHHESDGVHQNSTLRSLRGSQVDTVSNHTSRATSDRTHRRLLAWIDSVGGYLICLGDEVCLGQPSEQRLADIPILGDLSRRHATIRREGETYILTPIHTTSIDGHPLHGPAALRHGSVIGLGPAVRISFRLPHALSQTAVLQIVSNHKTEPTLDAVVLMSDSCILGPHRHCHVACRAWEQEIVLFRRGNELVCRSGQELTVDGQPCSPEAEIRHGCHVEGPEFAMSFEVI
jgi:hypothetical protein